MNPSLSGILDRRVQEDHLVLYPYLMHDGLDDHVALKELQHISDSFGPYNGTKTHLLFLDSLIRSSLIRAILQLRLVSPPVCIFRAVKLYTPRLDDLRQTA